MKAILRNLAHVLRRFRLATFLNVAGLSVAFAAFILIMMQVNYERTFDTSFKDAECIFRMELSTGGTKQAVISRPFAEAVIASSSHIKEGAILNSVMKEDFSILKSGEKHFYKESMRIVSPSVPRLFDFDMIEGDVNALEEPESIIIPESLSIRLFGGEQALGKQLYFKRATITIKGVYRDMPKNVSLSNVIYWAMSEKENKTNWANWNYEFYLKFDNPASAQIVRDSFLDNFDLKKVFGEDVNKELYSIRFTPLTDLHYTTDVMYDNTPKSSRQIVLILFTIALLIVVIASINFANFSTALAPMRIKSINTQKVLGGMNQTLRAALLFEAMAISFLAYLVSLVLVYLFPYSSFSDLISAETFLGQHTNLLLITACVSLVLGFASGFYPAYYVTSFPPALVLKGSFGLSPKGRVLRNLLVGIQFFAAFVLIIGAMFMYNQNHYMHKSPLGFNKDELIVCNYSNKLTKSWDAFAAEIKSFSGIEGVTSAHALLSSGDHYMGWGRFYKSENITFQCLPVEPSFLDVVDVKVAEGRSFREEDKATRHGVYIFNETARFKYDMELNSSIDSAEIIGFIPDIKFASFRTEIAPMAFFVWGTQNWGNIPSWVYVKVKAGSDLRAARQHIEKTAQKFDPETVYDVFFYDKVLNDLYQEEDKLTQQITLFSLIAVFLSIVGVFGLVVFECEYKRKEIGIRKVMGSTTGKILVMFNAMYIKILLVCLVLSAPIAWYVVRSWLENFAYKTPLYWWVFVLAFALVAFITVATVSFQSWRTANENPVNSIKTE